MSGLNVQQVQVFDTATGAPLNVAEGDVPALAAQGKVTFQRGAQIPVQDSSGVTGTVPAENAQEAFQQGYTVQPYQSRVQDAIQSQYGDTSGEVKAALAGTARGLTLGASDYVLPKLGVTTPEALGYYKQANPGASMAGELAGAAVPAFLSGGDSAIADLAGATPAGLVSRAGHAITEGASDLMGSGATQSFAAKLAQTAAAKAAGSAVEGALYSAGNVVSEASLGDPDVNAHHVMAELGMGALVGGIFGVAADGVGAGLGKLIPRRATADATETALRSEIGDQTAQAMSEPAAGAVQPGDAAVQGNAAPSPDAPNAAPAQPDGTPGVTPEAVQPQSVQDMVNRVKSGGSSVEMPQKDVVIAAEKLLAPELTYPMSRPQIDAMSDPEAYRVYQGYRESNTPDGVALRDYEAKQKEESVNLLNATVDNVAPGAKITADPAEAGNRVVDGFTDQYEAEQKATGKLFNQFDEIAPNVKVSGLDVIKAINQVIPDSEKMLKVQDGAMQLQPYSAAEMGISKSTYDAVAHIFKPLTENELTVAGLRNLRGTLDDYVTAAPGSKGYSSQLSQIGGLKKNLMDVMASKIDQVAPELNARSFFKRYAANQEGRGVIEKLLGGSISEKAGILKQIAPEKVGDRLFRDTVAVTAAKKILPDATWNEARANYLAEQVAKFTDKGAFRSQPFASWLKKNSSELSVAFADKPEVLQKLNALADRMRILPDAPSINPSGTAKTSDLLQKIAMIGKLGYGMSHPVAGAGMLAGKLLETVSQRMESAVTSARLADAMAGRSSIAEKETQYGTLKRIENASKSVSQKIQNSMETFFKGGPISKVAIPALALSVTAPDGKKNPYHQIIDQSAPVNADPTGVVDHIGDETAQLSRYAPHIASGVAALGSQAAAFLASKAPKNPYIGNTMTPQLHDWKPSVSDVSKFQRYANAVYHPLQTLNHLHDGTLSNEEVETLKTVYPKLYQQMGKEAVDQMTDLKSQLPYKKRVTLSKLLGVPYESSISPSSVAFLQANHLGAQAQEQGSGMSNNSASLPQSGLSKLNKSQNVMTDTERVQTRGG